MQMRMGFNMIDKFKLLFGGFNIQFAAYALLGFVVYTGGVYAYGRMVGSFSCEITSLERKVNVEKKRSKTLLDADNCLLSGGVWLQDSARCSMPVR